MFQDGYFRCRAVLSTNITCKGPCALISYAKTLHGIALQMLVFILINYEGFSIVLCVVTVLLEYLTDCSIRVS